MTAMLDHLLLSLLFATGGVAYVGFFALLAYGVLTLQSWIDREHAPGAAIVLLDATHPETSADRHGLA